MEPDAKLIYEGKEQTPEESGLLFAEYLMIEGVVGPDVDTYGEFFKEFLKKRRKG